MTEEQGKTLAKSDEVLKGAAVSAAVGAAVYGLRKALAERGEGLSLHQRDETDEAAANGKNSRPRNGSLLVTAFESASDSLLPLAEAAAEEVGRWAAKNSPALVRNRLLPRFIEAFKDAA